MKGDIYHWFKHSKLGQISADWFLTDTTRCLVTSFVFTTSGALILRTIWMMDRGFDFSDEAFYLMTIQRPSEYKWIFGLFGYALHPIFELAGESIVGLRRICAIILVVVGASAGLILLRNFKFIRTSYEAIQVVAVCALLPLNYYAMWLPTPSYNWLSFSAGLTLFISFLLLTNTSSIKYSVCWAAVTGVTAAFARPHGAIAFGALYLIAVLLVIPNSKNKALTIFAATMVTTILALVVAINLPLGDILNQIKVFNSVWGTTHPVQFSFFDQQWTFFFRYKAGLIFLFFFSAVILRFANTRIVNLISPFFMVGAFALIFVSILTQVFWANLHALGLQSAAIAFSLLAMSWLKQPSDFRIVRLLTVAAFIPWAATLGSSAPVHVELAFIFGIWLVVAFAAIAILVEGVVTAASVVAVCLTFFALNIGSSAPYRLSGTLKDQIIPTEIGWGSILRLDTRTAEFVRAMRADTKRNGFCSNGYAIDLSGGNPGMAFILDARMPIFPWIFGGYATSEYFGKEYFRLLGSDDLNRSWLITATPGRFTMEQLLRFGIDFSKYRIVSEIRYPLDNSLMTIFAPRAQVICQK